MKGSIYSGRNNKLAVATQAVFGTRVTPTQNLTHLDATGGFQIETKESESRQGNRASAGSFVLGGSGKLSISAEASPDNLGHLLKGLFGSETVILQSAGVYKHRFLMTQDTALPSLTFGISRDTIASVFAVGSIVSSLGLEVQPKDFVKLSSEILFGAEENTEKTITSVATNTITSAGHGYVDGDTIIFPTQKTGVVLPTGITARTPYYIINSTTDTFKLSLTSGGSAITITGSGTGTVVFMWYNSLTPSTKKPFILNRALAAQAQIDGVDCPEIKTLSLNLANNPDADNFTLNGGTTLYGIVAGAFTAGVSLSLIYNEETKGLRDKLLAGTRVALTLILKSSDVLGSDYYRLDIGIPKADITAAEPDTGGKISMKVDLSAVYDSTLGSPIYVDLYNDRATAY